MRLNRIFPARPAFGFALSEVLVATLMTLVVTASIFVAYRYYLFALKAQEAQLDTQETARGLIDLMTREIRLAGYDPTCAKTFAGIAAARAQWLQVQSDSDGDGAIGPSESITYSYDPNLGEINRSAGGSTAALVSGMPVNALAFVYYDGSGTVLTPSGSPAALSATQRAMIRRVQVVVHLEQPGPDPSNHRVVTSDFASNVDLRNRFLHSGVACP